MSDHAIRWYFDQDTVCSEVICNAKPDADCRLTCDEGCESFTIERDETGPYHLVATLGDDIRHTMREMGECNVCLFLEDALEEAYCDNKAFDLATVPIEPVWQGDYYTWRRAQ